MFELLLIGLIPVGDYYSEPEPRTNPPCFMRTRTGEKVDLTRLCELEEQEASANQSEQQSETEAEESSDRR